MPTGSTTHRIRQLPPRTVVPAQTATTEAAADTLTKLFAELRQNEARHDELLMLIAQAKGERA